MCHRHHHHRVKSIGESAVFRPRTLSEFLKQKKNEFIDGTHLGILTSSEHSRLLTGYLPQIFMPSFLVHPCATPLQS